MGDDDMDNDESEGTVHIIQMVDPNPGCIQHAPQCQAIVDRTMAFIHTGTSINILSLSMHKGIAFSPALCPTTNRVYAYGTSTCLPLAGVFNTTISHQGQATKMKVYVAERGADMLLGCHTGKRLHLVHFTFGVC
ncbi:hypothetical protein NDU88_007180 [Pleurodeles waltl]|uniref:Uncharacterized protein n=1 Tax=Pleurodeles waltl TaxID=8319 RepID=A0AAV7TZX5_PLEWA|nr:hypothetical protein NDU88_007180 [Pleurodeles waltl]